MYTVSWIPEKFAKVGKFVKLKDLEEWQDGWEVVEVGIKKDSKEVQKRSVDYRHQRKASDI
jgi:hypothetical protein